MARKAGGLLDDAGVASNLDLLSAWVEAQMAHRGQPGLSIGIVHDQELVWARGYGQARVEEKVGADTGTVYRIASITKLFTSTAVMQLRDAGKLQLDDPVTKHLPWFEIQDLYPEAPPITIRHLITHTSGLPREASFPYWTDTKFPTMEQIRESLPGQENVLATENRWKYSNLAFSLAGEVVMAVSGQEYGEYVRQHVLEPLGMTSTYIESPPADHPQLAAGYTRRLPNASRVLSPLVDSKGITSAANMATTVEDLARFVMLQFRDGPAGGQQVLSGATLREMHRAFWMEPDWQSGQGLGFRVTRQDGRNYIGHGGSVPGFRTHVQVSVEDKVGVIVLTNSDDGNPTMYVEKAFQWVAPAIRKAVAGREELETPGSGWERYLGRYRSRSADLQVLVLDGELVGIDPSQADPMPDLIRLKPVSEHAFRIESRNGSASIGELAVFEMDARGRVGRLKLAANYMEPVEKW